MIVGVLGGGAVPHDEHDEAPVVAPVLPLVVVRGPGLEARLPPLPVDYRPFKGR